MYRFETHKNWFEAMITRAMRMLRSLQFIVILRKTQSNRYQEETFHKYLEKLNISLKATIAIVLSSVKEDEA